MVIADVDSTGRLTDDLVAETKTPGGDRWKPSPSCLATWWYLYTTASTALVILGHMPLLIRPEHIVHFFRDVHGTYPITKEALRHQLRSELKLSENFQALYRVPVVHDSSKRETKPGMPVLIGVAK